MVLREQKTDLKEALSIKARRRRKALAAAAAAERLTGRLNDRTLPAVVIEMRDPASLHAPSLNVKEADDAQVARLGAAIERLEFVTPILIGQDDVIVDGVSSQRAALKLGLREVPTIKVGHLSKNQLSVLRLALNELPKQAKYNQANLEIEVRRLIEAQVSLDIVFEAPVIDLLLGEETGPDARDNAEPEVSRSKPTPMLGDTWLLGPHRAACADARDPATYAKLMGKASARIIVTDPPYNVGGDVVSGLRADRHGDFVMGSDNADDASFIGFLQSFLNAAIAHLVDGGLVYAFMDWRHIKHLILAGEAAGLTLQNVAVWVKAQGGMGSLYRSQHELIAIFKKGTAPHLNNVSLGKHGRDRTNVWTQPGANTMGSSARAALASHPTPKSVELIRDILLDVTTREDVVLDSFLGSGTTIVAAHREGRVAYGVELDPRYVEVIIERWEALTGIPARLEDTGETFEEVIARRRDEQRGGRGDE